MVPLSRFSILLFLCVFPAAALPAPAARAEPPPLLVNGDFEAKDEGGWSYLGHQDGSHGVFSEPSRPGTHSYLLQLAGQDSAGFSSISQVLNLKKDTVYRLNIDLWSQGGSCLPGAQGRQSATLGDSLVFERDLCAPGTDRGWTTFSTLFRAQTNHPPLQIRLAGQALDREASTTPVDRVTVEPAGAELPLPLLPGRPLATARKRGSLPLALGYALSSPSLHSLQDFRDRFQQTPAMAAVTYAWHDAAAPAPWPGLSAWTQHGVLPILSVPWFPEDLAEFQSEATQQRWRQLAQEARRWRYPLLLRLAPEMDLDFPENQSTQFTSFWNAVHRIFQDADARNVRWFWTPSQLGEKSHPFFPGDATVDLVGFSFRGADTDAILRRNVAEARQRYRTRPLAVAGSSAPPPSPAALLRSVPELAFFTLGDRTALPPVAGSPEAQAVTRALRHSSTLQPLPQLHPPAIQGRVIRKGHLLTIVLNNRDRRAPEPAASLRVEVWNGHPFLGGTPVKGYDGITVPAGRRKTLRLDLPPEVEAGVQVLIDRAADPRFLAPHPEDLDWKNDPDLLILRGAEADEAPL